MISDWLIVSQVQLIAASAQSNEADSDCAKMLFMWSTQIAWTWSDCVWKQMREEKEEKEKTGTISIFLQTGSALHSHSHPNALCIIFFFCISFFRNGIDLVVCTKHRRSSSYFIIAFRYSAAIVAALSVLRFNFQFALCNMKVIL